VDGRRATTGDGDVMHAHAQASGPGGFWILALMWLGMMAAMMAPTVWPWVRAFHRFAGDARDGWRATVHFVLGYLIAWLAYAIGASGLQLALGRGGLLDHVTATATSGAASAIFLAAGLYQFTPLKRACLTHCRDPLSYLLTRWRNGPIGGLRLGLHHGIFCVGCCWALMATALAVGVMSRWWMAALAATTFAEQVVPQGHRMRLPLGIALLAAAVWRLA
jgi:predicted metal-binding membrane protein